MAGDDGVFLIAQPIQCDLHVGKVLDIGFQCLLNMKRPGAFGFLGNVVKFFGNYIRQSNGHGNAHVVLLSVCHCNTEYAMYSMMSTRFYYLFDRTSARVPNTGQCGCSTFSVLSSGATLVKIMEWKKSYLAPDRFEIRREALLWYYQEGSLRMKAAGQEKARPEQKTDQREPCSPQEANISVKPENRMVGAYRTYEMNDVPTAGARDLGGPSWEKALVSRIREKNLAWTSEKTYRAWCRRFIASCGGKPITELGQVSTPFRADTTNGVLQAGQSIFVPENSDADLSDCPQCGQLNLMSSIVVLIS